MEIQANETILISRSRLNEKASFVECVEGLDTKFFQLSIKNFNLWGTDGLSPQELKAIVCAAFNWPVDYCPRGIALWSGSSECKERFATIGLSDSSVNQVNNLKSLITW